MATIMTARYDGRCSVCKAKIAKGSSMSYRRSAETHKGVVTCMACVNKAQHTAPPTPPPAPQSNNAEQSDRPARPAGWTDYASVDAFLSDVRQYASPHCRVEFAGDTWDGATSKARDGDLSAVADAEAIMDAIDHQIDIAGLRPQWGDSVVGAYPNVPAYLAGAPESMRARVMERSPLGPIRIFYSPVCSAIIGHADAHKRGLAVLSLVMALQRIRPVQVIIFTAYGIHDHTIAIRTEPMVLAEAAHCLTATSFYRALSYQLAKYYGWDGGWAQWYLDCENSEEAIEKAIRRQVGANEDDLVVPPMAIMHGAHEEMINTPAAWINRIMDKYRN